MNPITPLGDHIDLRRRDLAHEFSANRARRAGPGGGSTLHRRRWPATILATVAVGAAAFLAGGLLDTDAVSARPPAANGPVAEVTVATPDCVARPRPTERPMTPNPRTHRVAPRLTPTRST